MDKGWYPYLLYWWYHLLYSQVLPHLLKVPILEILCFQEVLLDYEGKLSENKEFLGWSLLEDAEKPDYLVEDIISIKDMNISLYPVLKDIEKEISEMETTEETTESSEQIKETLETDIEENSKSTNIEEETSSEKEEISSTSSEKTILEDIELKETETL